MLQRMWSRPVHDRCNQLGCTERRVTWTRSEHRRCDRAKVGRAKEKSRNRHPCRQGRAAVSRCNGDEDVVRQGEFPFERRRCVFRGAEGRAGSRHARKFPVCCRTTSAPVISGSLNTNTAANGRGLDIRLSISLSPGTLCERAHALRIERRSTNPRRRKSAVPGTLRTQRARDPVTIFLSFPPCPLPPQLWRRRHCSAPTAHHSTCAAAEPPTRPPSRTAARPPRTSRPLALGPRRHLARR